MSTLNVRRVVTGHDENGKAVVANDSEIVGKPLGKDGEFAMLWSTAEFPSDLNDEFDGAERNVRRTSPGGTVLQFIDLNPGARSAMHRTLSLDYGIVLQGELELELDDDVRVRLNAGDVVVQRGTIHAWANPGNAVTRACFVLLDASPVRIRETTLEPVG